MNEGRSGWPNHSSGEDESGFRSASEAGEHGRNNEGTVDSAYFSSDSQEDQEQDVGTDPVKRKRNRRKKSG